VGGLYWLGGLLWGHCGSTWCGAWGVPGCLVGQWLVVGCYNSGSGRMSNVGGTFGDGWLSGSYLLSWG